MNNGLHISILTENKRSVIKPDLALFGQIKGSNLWKVKNVATKGNCPLAGDWFSRVGFLEMAAIFFCLVFSRSIDLRRKQTHCVTLINWGGCQYEALTLSLSWFIWDAWQFWEFLGFWGFCCECWNVESKRGVSFDVVLLGNAGTFCFTSNRISRVNAIRLNSFRGEASEDCTWKNEPISGRVAKVANELNYSRERVSWWWSSHQSWPFSY